MPANLEGGEGGLRGGERGRRRVEGRRERQGEGEGVLREERGREEGWRRGRMAKGGHFLE